MIGSKNGINGKKLFVAGIFAPLVLVAGCSNSSSSGPSEGSSGQVATGFAYDGYLRGAKVCADVNFNKRCDEGEPSVTTGEGGQFELTGLTAAQVLAPLALEATAGVTVDEDTNTPVVKSFSYVAPAGSKAVSAVSTIIQVETERRIANGETPAAALNAAKSALATSLGVAGKDLTEFDPIAVAAQVTNSDSELASRLHLVNQVLTQNLISATESALAAGGTSDASAILYAAAGKVVAKASSIKTAIDAAVAASGGSSAQLDAEALSTIVADAVNDSDLQPGAVTTQDLLDAVQAVTAAQVELQEVIEEETGEDQPEPEAPSGGTGGTGGSGGGSQGTS